MRPRQGIVETFSTFLQFETDRFAGWVTDAKLRRSMLSSLTQSAKPETAETFWSLYWYKVWQAQPQGLAIAHLSAYLQEACYWTVKRTITGLSSVQYGLSDCFQIAIAKVDKVLRGFNPKQGFSLKNYASTIFGSAIRETLRQQREVDIATDWALLRKLSQKRLIESLLGAGLGSETISSYVLAWNCFKTIYISTQASATRQLPKPDLQTWEAIAKLYNVQYSTQLSSPKSEINPEQLEKWMISCAKAARAYLYPTFTSINTPKPGQAGEFLDDLPTIVGESLLSEIIAQEEAQTREAQQAQIDNILTTAIAKLDSQAQSLLQMYYAQGLTQQQMAQQMEMKQYAVSRRLTKAREALLLALAVWSQDTLHITLTPNVIKGTNAVLEEWLTAHYGNQSHI